MKGVIGTFVGITSRTFVRVKYVSVNGQTTIERVDQNVKFWNEV